MNASDIIDAQIAALADWRGTTFRNIRKIIRGADPEIVEELKWRDTPVWSHDGIVCLAKAFKDKIKITFPHGAHLSDPDKIFNAELEGNEWRAIDIHKDDKISESSLAAMVKSTVQYNQTKAKSKTGVSGTQSKTKKKSVK